MLNWLMIFLVCIPSFVRRCDTVPTNYYFANTQVNPSVFYRNLSVTQPVGIGDVTGWEIGLSVSGETFRDKPSGLPWWITLDAGTVQSWINLYASGPSPRPVQPPPPPTSVAYIGFFSDQKFSGIFSGRSGSINLGLHSTIPGYSAGSVSVKVTARIYKAILDETNQVHMSEITNGLMTSNQVTLVNVDTDTVSIPLTFTETPSFDNQNIYVLLGLEIDAITNTPSTNPRSHIVWLTYGAGSYLSMPTFIPRTVRSELICAPFNHPEMYIYISPDGEQYPLDVDGSRVVLNDQGTGTPPYDYITQRGPFQHGESLIAAYAKPRVVQLTINQNYNNRDSYWNGRANLLAQLSPRKQALDGAVESGVLRRILSTGEKRDLSCLITEGPKFEPRHEDQWQEYSYTETLRFIAFDPIYYDPLVKTYTFSRQGLQLVFPIVFPISFSTIIQEVSIPYTGSWLTYPTFTITGPMTFVHLMNRTTNEKIEIVYDLIEGETITIDLAYGHKTITKDDGTNLLPYVSDNSDLGTFHLTEVNGGVNDMHVHMDGVMQPSLIEMSWQDRYVGI